MPTTYRSRTTQTCFDTSYQKTIKQTVYIMENNFEINKPKYHNGK